MDPHRRKRARAPETKNWQCIVSNCPIYIRLNHTSLDDDFREKLSNRIAYRGDVVQFVRKKHGLSRSDAEEVVEHAIYLNLLGITKDGQHVYIPDNRGECQ